MPAELMITPQPFDDSVFTPYDKMPELGPVTTEISMTVDFGTNNAGQYRGYLNGVDYIPQKVPTLYTALNAPLSVVKNPAIYGANSNPYVLPFNSVVELTVTNHDDFSHPFHLHGHNFQVVGRGSGGALFPANPPAGAPMRRDTVMMYAGATVTIRFVADNPGISLFHCHIEWHVEAGLTATFIEAPDVLQSYKLAIPASHKNVCTAQGIAMTGNAAGNTTNYLNLAGANTVPGANPYG
jgi:iron transport multicopper oxidase